MQHNSEIDSAIQIAKALEPSTIPPRGGVYIRNVSKRFRKATLVKKSYSTVKSTLLSRVFRKHLPRDNFIQALAEVTIEVKPGQSVGIIGRNGSGKSTLLKLIAGIYQPDSGTVQVDGKISALIELGAGFHPDFTGRENVYLGGVMFGLTRKQIDERFDSIVRYAELEDFIDDPVRTYSSGMYMRLGFSLAVHTDPDVLLIDEVLAVGDAAFIHRCHDTISEFRRRGKTLVFVTHDLDSVARWCDEAIWLQRGVIKRRGEPLQVIDSYLQNVEDQEKVELSQLNQSRSAEENVLAEEQIGDSHRWGSKEVEITAVRMFGADGKPSWVFHTDDSVTVEVDFKINQAVEELVFGVGVIRADGLVVHGTNTDIDGEPVPLPDFALKANSNLKAEASGWTGTYRYNLKRLGLLDNTYFLDVAAHSKEGRAFDYHHRQYQFSVRGAAKLHGVYNPAHEWGFHTEYAPTAMAEQANSVNRRE